MEWYYSQDSKQKGPVSAADLIVLQKSDTLSGGSLVWREGMADWKEFREVADEIFTAAGEAATETAVCAHSGKVLAKNEMVPYGDAWVAPEYKEAFVQRMMEGERLELNEDGVYALQYVGFWWRVLAAVIDYFVKIIPVMLCQIPYYIALFANEAERKGVDGEPPNPMDIWTASVIIAYAVALGGQLAISIFYETWMIGKYQATVGKMAIGVVVVDPDGRRITYGRSFGRWAAKKLLNGTIAGMVVMVPIVLFAVFGAGSMVGGEGTPNAEGIIGMMGLMFGAMLVLYPLALFPYWMCGRDAEKRTLHDRVCATRVVKKKTTV